MNNLRYSITIGLCLVLGFSLKAQTSRNINNHWHFGVGLSLDFNFGSPGAVGGSSIPGPAAAEGTASVSDDAGNLLLYTDGQTIYDRTGAVMAGHAAGSIFGSGSTTQGVLIAPHPGNPDIYYVITNGTDYSNTNISHDNQIHVTTVDLSVGANGSVTSANVLLYTNARTEEKIALAPSDDGGYWLVVPQTGGGWLANGSLARFKIDPVTGLSTTAQIQNNVTQVSNNAGFGELTFSNGGCDDGSVRIAMVHHGNGATLGWGDFNIATGLMSNMTELGGLTVGGSGLNLMTMYGAAFSPNERYLYVSAISPNKVMQIDLVTNVVRDLGATSGNAGGSIELGPDDRIYVASRQGTHIGVIANPDSPVAGFNSTAIASGGSNVSLGLPNQIPVICTDECTPPTNLAVLPDPANLCVGDDEDFTVTFNGTPNDDYYITWYNNVGGIDRAAQTDGTAGSEVLNLTNALLTEDGTWTVRVEDGNVGDANCYEEVTFDININATPTAEISIAPNDTICVGETAVLTPNATSGTFQWEDNSTSNPRNITVTGDYTLTATAGVCSHDSTVHIEVLAVPTVSIGSAPSLEECAGTDIDLSVTNSAGSTFTWDDDNSSTSPRTVTATGNYAVTATNGYCDATDDVDVTINPKPVASIDPVVGVCLGVDVNLNATSDIAGSSFLWIGTTTGLSATNINNPTATTATTATYEVEVTSPDNCKDSATIQVTINQPPVVDAGPDATVCSGVSTTLNASGAVNYSWAPTTGLSDPLIGNPDANPSSTTTYIVTGTDLNNCQDTSEVTVSISNLPSMEIGADQAICDGEMVQLNSDIAMNTYSWTPSGIMSNDAIQNPVATTSSTVMVFLDATDLDGCDHRDSLTITVNEVPVASITIADDSICDGETALPIAASTVTGSTFEWINTTTGLSSTTVANPNATPSTTTTYTVEVTAPGDCKDTEDVTVIVSPIPNVDAGSPVGICSGDNTQLTATGATTYSWSPATGLSDASISNPVATPSATTTYTVTGTTDGCVNTDQVEVTVNINPDHDLGPDVAVCLGESVPLSADLPMSTYSWTPASASFDNSSSATPTATPTSTVMVFLDATDSDGCAHRDSMTITVNQNPTAAINGIDEICVGQNTSLMASGGASYFWKRDQSTLSATTGAGVTATPTTTTTYEVVVTDGNNCKDSTTFDVTVNALPNVDAGVDRTVCLGVNVTLGASGASTYSWSPATGLSDPNIFNPVASPAATTTYIVTGTDASMCVNTDTITVFSLDNPVPSVSITYDTDVCEGDAVNFSISASQHLGPGPVYTWSRTRSGSTTTVGQNSPTLSLSDVQQGDVYELQVVSDENCVDPANVTAVSNQESPSVYAYPAPVISGDLDLCAGESTTLTVVDNNGLNPTYSWSNGGTGDSQSFTNMQSNETVSVTAINQGCSTTSAPVEIVVTHVDVDLFVDNDNISFGDNVTLTAETDATNLTWSTLLGGEFASGSSKIQIRTPQITSTYVVVVDLNGCIAQASVEVVVLAPISAPYFFSPNGDGDNDEWIVSELESYDAFTVDIFNRWGSKVRKYENEMDSWDGNNESGNALPDGVYFYVIKTGTDTEVVSLTGYVTLSK